MDIYIYIHIYIYNIHVLCYCIHIFKLLRQVSSCGRVRASYYHYHWFSELLKRIKID